MKLRVVVLGDDMIKRRLSASLVGQEIEVFGMMVVLGGEHFDLAVVDSLVEDVEAACRSIKRAYDVPVVLMVRGKQADWEKLQLLDVDAFIPEGVSGAELVARLRAVVRRHSGQGSERVDRRCETVGSNHLE